MRPTLVERACPSSAVEASSFAGSEDGKWSKGGGEAEADGAEEDEVDEGRAGGDGVEGDRGGGR